MSNIDNIDDKYAWRPGMGEISGFGGGYEQACRRMLRAGLAWLDAHPTADPKISTSNSVYGIIREDNVDAKELSAVVGNAEDGCTGAMHQAVMSSLLFIRKHGWEKYVEEMSRP